MEDRFSRALLIIVAGTEGDFHEMKLEAWGVV